MALRHAEDTPSEVVESPAEVDFLVVCKEALVESANSPEVVTTYHQAGSGRPKHLHNVVVLSLVFLHGLEDAATAVGVAIAVDVASACSCVLEVVTGVLRQKLRLACCRLGMGVHEVDERTEPVFADFHIAVEKHIIRCAHLL